ncbi:MAG: hypothetical protein KJ065_26820 [Anaerolineae bacterium]|nr:hypothetical protein [Anaerolineae bacterium]
MRTVVTFVLLLVFASVAAAQDTPTPTPTPTETLTPTPTSTPTPEPFILLTLPPPADGGETGQMARVDFTISAGEIHIANLLTWLLYSVWGMFLFAVLVLMPRSKK